MTGHANEKLKVGHIHACGFMQNTDFYYTHLIYINILTIESMNEHSSLCIIAF